MDNEQANEAQQAPLSFKLSDDQRAALKVLGGGRGVRLAGIIKDDNLVIDMIALNNGIVKIADQPFNVPGMAPFIACNGPMET